MSTATAAASTRRSPTTMRPSDSIRIMPRHSPAAAMSTATAATSTRRSPTTTRPSASIRAMLRPSATAASSTTTAALSTAAAATSTRRSPTSTRPSASIRATPSLQRPRPRPPRPRQPRSGAQRSASRTTAGPHRRYGGPGGGGAANCRCAKRPSVRLRNSGGSFPTRAGDPPRTNRAPRGIGDRQRGLSRSRRRTIGQPATRRSRHGRALSRAWVPARRRPGGP